MILLCVSIALPVINNTLSVENRSAAFATDRLRNNTLEELMASGALQYASEELRADKAFMLETSLLHAEIAQFDSAGDARANRSATVQ